jgi:capsular exopolysaccharide synthesis family protein
LDKLAVQSSDVVILARSSSPELTLSEIWKMLWRRRRIIYGSVAVSLLLAVLALMASTRRYQSIGEIQVQKDSTSSLGLQTDGSDTPSDALEENMVLQTQARILQSDSLALRVINELHLDQTEDYREKWSPLGWVFGLLAPKGRPDPKGASLEDSPHRRVQVLRIFHKKLTVKVVDGTRLIDAEYLSPDPQLAAAIVNHMLQGLIETGFQARYTATTQASSWLSGQLDDLRAQTQNLQAKVVRLRQDSGVFALGEVDREGKDQVYSPTLDKLQMSTQAVAQAQANRILKGAIYDVVKTGNPEMISGLSGNTILATSSSGIGSSLTLIQNLRLQEATLQGQLQQLSAKFGPSYPKLGEIQGNLNAVQAAIRAEVGRVAERARNDFIVAEQTEQNTRKDFNVDKSAAETLNNRTIEYQMARQEADQSRLLYEDLLRHLKESGLLAGLRSTNISIVDPGRPADKPAKPVTLLYLFGSLVAGLFVGSAAALLRDLTDTKIQDVQEISRELGATPLCVLPYQKERTGMPAGLNKIASSPLMMLPTLDNPRSVFVESLRSLRTSLLMSRSGSPPRIVLVTSPLPGEGKSFISWNLAILFAQQGKRVLLCDADLRRPRLHRDMQIDAQLGLSTVLTGLSDDHGASALVPIPEVPGLYLMPAGPTPPYPSELLSSDHMETLLNVWKSQFDLVLLDSPPILPVTDSVVLSSFVDSVLLIARHQKTPLSALERSYQMLEAVPAESTRKINVLVNGVREQPAAGHVFYEYPENEYVRP